MIRVAEAAHGNCCELCQGRLAQVRDLVERREGQNYVSWSWERALNIILGEAPTGPPCPLCIASEFGVTGRFLSLIELLDEPTWIQWCTAVGKAKHRGCADATD